VSVVNATVTQYNLTDGNDTVIIFNGTGTIDWEVPDKVTIVNYLIVAGGGAGGANVLGTAAGGGGGGAGGVRTSISTAKSGGNISNETPYVVSPFNLINITVGAGGSYNPDTRGGNGFNSSFGTILSLGGGGGGFYNYASGNGNSGGSGGGGGAPSGTGGSAITSIVTMGTNGASKVTTDIGGGGGGAQASPTNYNGGIGIQNPIINGTPIYYGGGGGAGWQPGTGGLGGGGKGARDSGNPSVAGTDGTGGGGGGGGGNGVGSSGGSGIVIIRYNTEGDPTITNFTADILEGSTPLTVHFTDTSENTPTIWNWSFGDSNFSESKNPTHVFRNPGYYTITLNSSNVYGYNISTKINYINVTNHINDTWYYVNDDHYERTNGSYTIAKYNKTGTYTWRNLDNKSIEVEYLIIGGGGSGNSSAGNGAAGGGAGGFINGTNTSIISGESYSITVGIGGSNRANGGNSSFNGIIAIGGGRAGSTGADGGSGGGGGNFGTSGFFAGGNGTPGQGYNGGSGYGNSGQGGGGGGGGASQAGFNGSDTPTPCHGGNGGNGKNSSITGEEITYAGGGAGSIGTYEGVQGIGGLGGGGNVNTNGTNELGGGGGAGYGGTTVYSGGSGIVILKYETPLPPAPLPTPTPTPTPHRITVEDKMNDAQGFIVIGIYLMIGTVIIALIGKVVLDQGK